MHHPCLQVSHLFKRRSLNSEDQKLYSLGEPPLGVSGGPPRPPPANLPTPRRTLRAGRSADVPGEDSDSFDSDDGIEDSARERASGRKTSSARDRLNFGPEFKDSLGPLPSLPPSVPRSQPPFPANFPRPLSPPELTGTVLQRTPTRSLPRFQNSTFSSPNRRGPGATSGRNFDRAGGQQDNSPVLRLNRPGTPDFVRWPVNISGEATVYSDSDDSLGEKAHGKRRKKNTSSARSNVNFGPGSRDSEDFIKASRVFEQMAGKAWKSSDTYSHVNSTISRDNTMGEVARRSKLLADFGQKTKACVFISVQSEDDMKPALGAQVEETFVLSERLYIGNLPPNGA